MYEEYDEPGSFLYRLTMRVMAPLFRLESRYLRWRDARWCASGGHTLVYTRSFHVVGEREVDALRCDCGAESSYVYHDTGEPVPPDAIAGAIKQALYDSTRMFALLPKKPWVPVEDE